MLNKLFWPKNNFGNRKTPEVQLDLGALSQRTCLEDERPQAWSLDFVTKQ